MSNTTAHHDSRQQSLFPDFEMVERTKPLTPRAIQALHFIKSRGADGATNDEIIQRFNWAPSATSASNELWRAGLVQKSGIFRPTRWGGDGEAWIATEGK